MRYLPAVPSKFVCAKLQTFKWNSVLYARAAHVSTRAAYIFHARWVILKRSGLRSHSWEGAGNRDAQSHDPERSKQIKLIKQNSPGAVVCWRHSLFWASHGLMLVGGWGSINLYHSVWELPIMHVVWKIQPSHSCCIDSESMPLKMLFNLYFRIELWHLYKSLLPSAKGLSIYFYVESSPSY